MIELPPPEDSAPADANAKPIADEMPKTRRRPRARKDAAVVAPAPAVEVPVSEPATEAEAPVADEAAKPKRRSRAKKAQVVDLVEPALPATELAEVELAPKPARAAKAAPKPVNDADAEAPESDGPPRSGWWSRTFG